MPLELPLRNRKEIYKSFPGFYSRSVLAMYYKALVSSYPHRADIRFFGYHLI